ncbi:hypothetical protein DICPUDRAFT_99260 [Dictyostelium purpureum]|uniref:Core Histone H2A/H2B/H3 domain-containing protein n=1 Tax=Dictyostelium purpureum TaxID=5786 RepID=F0ZXR2_DICPU|nr:uncharacterized protein DICPUDRAFT_99260 [Dictyostelium purpureum]EGC31270.1 hypothetical protein DICPUDRAFT_99260 [Dictyostelium purpureum]|eukprot:XP_003292215.1 hypothetical protein DICPUDRAFT_99260 [Dictyostelium purpureum]
MNTPTSSQQSQSQQTPSSQQLSQSSQLQSQQSIISSSPSSSQSLWANVIHKINTQSRQLMKEKILLSSPSSQKSLHNPHRNSKMTPSSSMSSPIPMWDTLTDIGVNNSKNNTNSNKSNNINNEEEENDDDDDDDVRRNIDFGDFGSGGFDDISENENNNSQSIGSPTLSVYTPPSNKTPKKRLGTTQIAPPKTRKRLELEDKNEENNDEDPTPPTTPSKRSTPKKATQKKTAKQVASPMTRQKRLQQKKDENISEEEEEEMEQEQDEISKPKPTRGAKKNARQDKKTTTEVIEEANNFINSPALTSSAPRRLPRINIETLSRTQRTLLQQDLERDIDESSSDESDDNEDYIDSEDIDSDNDFLTDFDNTSYADSDSSTPNNKKQTHISEYSINNNYNSIFINNNNNKNNDSSTNNTTEINTTEINTNYINSESTTPNLTSFNKGFDEEISKLRNDDDNAYTWDFNDREEYSDSEVSNQIFTQSAITDAEEEEDNKVGKIITIETKETKESTETTETTETTSTKVTKTKKPRKPRVSLSKKCGLTFPVSRVHSILKSNKFFKVPRISKCSTVYLTAVLQYVCEELLILSMEYCEQRKRNRIQRRDILKSIKRDCEFKRIHNNLIINSDTF